MRTERMLRIGQRWRRRRTGRIWEVAQIHRADKCVFLRPLNPSNGDVPTHEPFVTLRRFYQLMPERMPSQAEINCEQY